VKRGQTVVYISTHRKFAPGADSLPTFPEDAAAPVSDLLDKIQMMCVSAFDGCMVELFIYCASRYFDDESSIINFLSDLHNKPLPDVIILDDAQDMIHASKDRFASYIRIIAFAKEAADYLATAKPKRDSTPTDNMDFSGDDDEEHELNNNDGLCDCGILFVDSTVGTEVEQHKKAETLRRWFSSSITVSAIQGTSMSRRDCCLLKCGLGLKSSNLCRSAGQVSSLRVGFAGSGSSVYNAKGTVPMAACKCCK
jgi:hypothetical protein